MSRTKHHNAPKRAKLFKLPNRYTGWLGEGATTTEFRKRVEHRANRRYGFKDTLVRVKDALFGKDVPLPFEREYVDPQPVVVLNHNRPMPQVWIRKRLIRSV